MRSGKLEELTAPPGLCARCVHLRLLRSKTSTFVRCGRAGSDPAFPRYPVLPVLRCRGFEEGGETGDDGDD